MIRIVDNGNSFSHNNFGRKEPQTDLEKFYDRLEVVDRFPLGSLEEDSTVFQPFIDALNDEEPDVDIDNYFGSKTFEDKVTRISKANADIDRSIYQRMKLAPAIQLWDRHRDNVPEVRAFKSLTERIDTGIPSELDQTVDHFFGSLGVGVEYPHYDKNFR